MTAQMVLVMPAWEKRTKVGMTSAVAGTMTAPSSTAKLMRRPANRNFAKPYPASTASAVAPIPPTIAYNAELNSHRA